MPVRRRYHFHTPGLVYIFITVLIALGAFNSQNNLLFWAFGFALSILVVSGLISGQMLMGIRADRTAAGRAVVGEPITLSYRITNRSRLVPAFAIGASEIPVDGASTAAPSARSATLAKLSGKAPAPLAYTFLIHLGPRETTDIAARFTPVRRGTLPLSDFSLETTFPFGIVRKSLLFRQPRTILIHPRQIAPPPGLLQRRRSVGQSAAPRAARPGSGEEYFTLREYIAGDSPRSIAWRASARSDQLLVRQNSLPVPQRLLVLLRLDRGQSAEANEDAISLAAGIISAAASANYEIGLIVPGAAVDRRPTPGRAQGTRLLDDLALIDLDALEALPTAATRARVPVAVARGTLAIAVHAGTTDTSFGPAGTVHVSASAQPPPPAAPAKRAPRSAQPKNTAPTKAVRP
jgi:uncharacterized protein (DUF58 family)